MAELEKGPRGLRRGRGARERIIGASRQLFRDQGINSTGLDQLCAVAQVSKQAFVYVLDRTNGQPVWPIEERPVPQGNVPGEWYSPTQPFVTKPPAFDRQGVSTDDLIDFTPALREEAIKVASRYKIGPIFTPPTVSASMRGSRSSFAAAPACGSMNTAFNAPTVATLTSMTAAMSFAMPLAGPCG